MSRHRKLDKIILSLPFQKGHGLGDEDDTFTIPLDIAEQDELITNFQLSVHKSDTFYTQIITILYLGYCIFFLLILKKGNKVGIGQKYPVFLKTAPVNSVALSLINLRYSIRYQIKFIKINNFTLNMINALLLTILVILSINTSSNKNLHGIFIHALFNVPPVLFFLLSIFAKKWNRNLNEQIGILMKSKYNYKSA
ncbi:uncharacterized protein SCDLUD_001452 [Saccharomycodes ludwigii]|uniref:uncharacterized protein n=1 Tax=Saccharomycodes ludwigii TaxID=36035 RepID=UPI001E831860|nr:hypothetical protein SCDLUD_001452 [Saccharomycodes ludwigii]KAH3901681.1 hypothetical protein SCDLUD_001452 [Saccharomycodes ludwigii]